jgi:5-methylcytosine-specific restriction endonuclease McrA
MAPHEVISWQRAIVLFFLGKVEVLEEYDECIRSVSITLRAPAVVRLTHSRVPSKRKVRFSRSNVLLRDGFRCQYCGECRPAHELNCDHVLPRVRGGKACFENMVASCYACNDRKGSRTPEEAGMTLLRRPARPSTLPLVPVVRPGVAVPEAWRTYCAKAG